MAAQTSNIQVLDTRSRFRHDNGRRDLELTCRKSDTLGVVTGRTAHNTLPALLWVEMGHLVVSAAQLEAEYGLLVFTLEEDIAFESVAEVDSVCEGSDLAGLVDSGCGAGDKTKVLRLSASQLRFVDAILHSHLGIL